MNESCRKLLTEYIGECWHEDLATENGRCPICDKGLAIPMGAGRALMPWNRRTFTTPDDMNAVYSAIHRNGKWEEFIAFVSKTWCVDNILRFDTLTGWLFCLSGYGYEERCDLAGEWLESLKEEERWWVG